MKVILDTKLTPNLCLEGLQREVEHIIATAKKKNNINSKDKIKILFVINIKYDDLLKYVNNENKKTG